MRILFTTFPWTSHHFPMVPLEWACRTAGHEVRVASSPALMDAVTRSGLPAVSVGKDVDLAAITRRKDLAPWHQQERWPLDWPVHTDRLTEEQRALIENLAAMQFTMAGAMVDDLVAFARDWRPDLVVHDAVSFAGPVAAAACGVPAVSHLWGSPGLQRIERRGHGDEPLPGYVELHERCGAPVRTHPAAWVDPCPPSMRYPDDAVRLPLRYVPYNGPGELPQWLEEPPAERERICVTWGATTAKLMGEAMLELFRQAVQAAAARGAEVLVAVTAAMDGMLGELPENARTVVDVPLHLLLPTCSAVVHHGGAGTTLTAASLGLPQLTVTRRPEPTLTGSRQAATGAGRHLRSGDVTFGPEGVRLLSAELAALLDDPAPRAAADRLRAEIQSLPTPADVADRLPELV